VRACQVIGEDRFGNREKITSVSLNKHEVDPLRMAHSPGEDYHIHDFSGRNWRGEIPACPQILGGSAGVCSGPGALADRAICARTRQNALDQGSASMVFGMHKMEGRSTMLNPRVRERCFSSFSKQAFMTTLDARLLSLELGSAVIEVPFNDKFTQQHGFLHGGVVTSVLDSACGYAALTTMELDSGVLTVELKINLVKPAAGSLFQAHGKVVRAGRTLIVCTGEVCAEGDERNVIAVMQATMMAVRERAGIKD
jgi:uncharacterized protein (TIGR00369 family)